MQKKQSQTPFISLRSEKNADEIEKSYAFFGVLRPLASHMSMLEKNFIKTNCSFLQDKLASFYGWLS